MGRLCYLTKHPATILVLAGGGAGKLSRWQDRYGALFAVRVQVLWPIRVSRYMVYRKQGTSQVTPSFIVGTGAIAL